MRRTILLFLWPLLTSVGQSSAVPINTGQLGTAAGPGLSAPDPSRALTDFLNAYWDADQGYFLAWNRSAPFSRPSGSGPSGGKYTDFWWEAQLWDLVLDAAERAPKNTETRQLIGDVYDGFVRAYPDWQNDFNDDLGWWAQASMRAYKFTGNARYLQRAATLFDSIWPYWTDTVGGGVLWRRSGSSQKNVATNGPLTVTAVRLYQATRDPKYRLRAQQLYAFVDTRLTDGDARVYDNIENGELRRWDFTYNVGNFVLAALALREVTDDPAQQAALLTRATRSTDWALAHLTNAGILLDEGAGDGGGFKGVFLRALRTLSETPELDSGSRERYLQSLRDQATQVWNQRRVTDGLVGPDWSAPHEGGVIESLAAGAAVAALQLAPSPLSAQIVVGDGRYEAENSAREGVSSSTVAAGFSGRGYVNNFSQSGQFVEFRVNAPEARSYPLKLRYSAGGGAVQRILTINGAAQALTLAPTSNWTTWAEQEMQVGLPAGSSRIRIAFDRAGGSRGWLNLDRLTLGDLK
ncbi:carbohydrate-binding protein [Deinococcus sp. Arct2-2]|uniref:glycoside hydrolase family 76 protein n=1 Tax=Deinococcus sp. Arct2-2 TaxID=2568653 RepID=UPI0010A343DC|nr:glycoside hydrolase family 76 protein [Deinococcus sp. Arct2-2]THF71560.1 carbohydrate-binding protein [Deinococcus sp. Arct2-2]